MSWTPILGAWLDKAGSHFRVWAPRCRKIWVHPGVQAGDSRRFLLAAGADGYFEGTYQELGEGDKYWYELDDEGCFPDPQKGELIPDPQAKETFWKSCLHWEEIDRKPHLGIFRLFRDLIRLRKEIHDGYRKDELDFRVECLGRNSIMVYWIPTVTHPGLLHLVRLKGPGAVRLKSTGIGKRLALDDSTVLFSTEDSSYLDKTAPPEIDTTRKSIFFARPGALLLRLA